jgi:hypothetical protein
LCDKNIIYSFSLLNLADTLDMELEELKFSCCIIKKIYRSGIYIKF